MVLGQNKPSGYTVHYTSSGKRIEEETRQCVHCQYTWIYRLGSGIQRSICKQCMGLTCGQPKCLKGCAPYSLIASEDDKRFVLGELIPFIQNNFFPGILIIKDHFFAFRSMNLHQRHFGSGKFIAFFHRKI